ncbi:MAG: outer membrane lipoprotein carrier protein LolA [Verrucomicrobiales bacterium]|nr:outer membrane lipoprotein carrier protein LolA [Verrucomicrobiales bacterium]
MKGIAEIPPNRATFATRAVVAALSGLALVLASLPVRSTEPTNDVLRAWLAVQSTITNWSADFVQTRTFKSVARPLVSTGHVWFARPNAFRWELGRPVQTLAVRDADELRVLYPRLRREERYDLAAGRSGVLGEALGLLDAGFPRDAADFADRFRLLALTPVGGAWHLDLQPASAAARRVMPGVRLVLDSEYTLVANEIAFPDGSRIRNDFSAVVANAPLPPDIFRPPTTAEYRIVHPATR